MRRNLQRFFSCRDEAQMISLEYRKIPVKKLLTDGTDLPQAVRVDEYPPGPVSIGANHPYDLAGSRLMEITLQPKVKIFTISVWFSLFLLRIHFGRSGHVWDWTTAGTHSRGSRDRSAAEQDRPTPGKAWTACSDHGPNTATRPLYGRESHRWGQPHSTSRFRIGHDSWDDARNHGRNHLGASPSRGHTQTRSIQPFRPRLHCGVHRGGRTLCQVETLQEGTTRGEGLEWRVRPVQPGFAARTR